MGFIFMIFSALYDRTNIFSIRRQDKSAAITKFTSWKFLIAYKNGIYFSWFFLYKTMTQIFFRFDDKIKVPTTHKWNFIKFKLNTEMGFIFHDFSSAIRLHNYFFDMPAESKCRHLKVKFWKFLIYHIIEFLFS